MSFVLDASVTACWAFHDEYNPRAEIALARIQVDEAVVPGIWWFEIRNILVVGERRRRIAEPDTAGFLRYLSSFRVRTDRLPDESQVLRLARTYRLSVYDASYLELAQRECMPLATLDADLLVAAQAESVPLINPPTQ